MSSPSVLPPREAHDDGLDPARDAAPARRALSIYAARETLDTLRRTVDAAVIACRDVPSIVDVMVNGNRALAQAIADSMRHAAAQPDAARGTTAVRVWSVRLGDKAHAWNQYVHNVAPPASSYFFVDGYARLRPDAVHQLEDAAGRAEKALAATGVPSVGSSARASAREMRAEGGIQGNCHMLTADALRQLRSLRFKLPLGLYRTDATLGAALAFGLDLHPRQWRLAERVVVCDSARWDIDALRWWRWSDLLKQGQRLLRQAQGDLENQAVRQMFSHEKAPFGALPRTALELVDHWLAADGDGARAMLRWHPLRQRALRKLRDPRDWTAAQANPECLFASAPSSDLSTRPPLRDAQPATMEP